MKYAAPLPMPDAILVLAEAKLTRDRALPALWNEYKKIAGDKPMVLAISKSDSAQKIGKELLPILTDATAISLNLKSLSRFLQRKIII